MVQDPYITEGYLQDEKQSMSTSGIRHATGLELVDKSDKGYIFIRSWLWREFHASEPAIRKVRGSYVSRSFSYELIIIVLGLLT